MEMYKKIIAEGDPRTNNWPLIRSPTPVLTLIVLYLWVVHKGPKFMENRKPFNLKTLLLAYNGCLVLLSLYIFVETLLTSYLSNYSYTCQLVDYAPDPLPLRMAHVAWWFYMAKIIELMDTVFFVLRKKVEQITFLHVYHHCTMLVICWVATKYFPGGQVFIAILINSFVHVVMYCYYFLSILGDRVRPYLWWKRYLTQMQMIQFLIGMGLLLIGLYHNCQFPHGIVYIGLFYASTLTILFANYYLQTYRKMRIGRMKTSIIKSD